MSPQHVRVTLRAGEEHNITLKFARAMNYPLDLYLLLDSSLTLQNLKKPISQLGRDLSEDIRNLTRDFRLGFGTFIDKVAMPFTNTHPERYV